MIRFDYFDLPVNFSFEDEAGFLRGEAPVTRTGVFTYQNADGSIRKELRHPDDVFKAESLATLQMVPITLGHPTEGLVTADNAKALSVGNTGETVRPDGSLLYATLVISDAAAKQAIENGVREFSCGYEVDLVEEPGEYNGISYDYRQTNIRYNHVAIVDQGRAGPEVRLNELKSDSAIQVKTDAAQAVQTKPEELHMEKNLVEVRLDNGLSYQAAPEVAQALDALRKEREELEAKIKPLVTVALDDAEHLAAPAVAEQISKLRADVDAKAEEIEKLKKVDHSEAIKRRVALDRVARTVLDAEQVEKLDSMSDAEIMRAVILSQTPADRREEKQAKLDAEDETYVRALFDHVAEGIKLDSGAQAIAVQRAITTSPNTAAAIDLAEKARLDMIARLNGKNTKREE